MSTAVRGIAGLLTARRRVGRKGGEDDCIHCFRFSVESGWDAPRFERRSRTPTESWFPGWTSFILPRLGVRNLLALLFPETLVQTARPALAGIPVDSRLENTIPSVRQQVDGRNVTAIVPDQNKITSRCVSADLLPAILESTPDSRRALAVRTRVRGSARRLGLEELAGKVLFGRRRQVLHFVRGVIRRIELQFDRRSSSSPRFSRLYTKQEPCQTVMH